MFVLFEGGAGGHPLFCHYAILPRNPRLKVEDIPARGRSLA